MVILIGYNFLDIIDSTIVVPRFRDRSLRINFFICNNESRLQCVIIEKLKMSSGLRQQDNNITGYEFSNICNQRVGCLSGARVMSSLGVMYSQPHCIVRHL